MASVPLAICLKFNKVKHLWNQRAINSKNNPKLGQIWTNPTVG